MTFIYEWCILSSFGFLSQAKIGAFQIKQWVFRLSKSTKDLGIKQRCKKSDSKEVTKKIWTLYTSCSVVYYTWNLLLEAVSMYVCMYGMVWYGIVLYVCMCMCVHVYLVVSCNLYVCMYVCMDAYNICMYVCVGVCDVNEMWFVNMSE